VDVCGSSLPASWQALYRINCSMLVDHHDVDLMVMVSGCSMQIPTICWTCMYVNNLTGHIYDCMMST